MLREQSERPIANSYTATIYGETKMADIKNALAKLEKANMHIKQIETRDLAHEYLTPIDTHYIMQGDKIVHIGNKNTVIAFALRLAV